MEIRRMNKTPGRMLHEARMAWHEARDARDEEVACAARTKSGMGNSYWHAERAARLRYEALLAIADALNEKNS
jgi:hypothetical protein